MKKFILLFFLGIYLNPISSQTKENTFPLFAGFAIGKTLERDVKEEKFDIVTKSDNGLISEYCAYIYKCNEGEFEGVILQFYKSRLIAIQVESEIPLLKKKIINRYGIGKIFNKNQTHLVYGGNLVLQNTVPMYWEIYNLFIESNENYIFMCDLNNYDAFEKELFKYTELK